MPQNVEIILASGSRYRKAVLESLGLEIQAIKPEIDEEELHDNLAALPLEEQAMELAKEKSFAVCIDYPEALTIAGDQICTIDGKILPKPGNRAHAIEQIKELQGKTHQLLTAIAVYQDETVLFEYLDTINLTMKPLSDDKAVAYVDLEQAYDTCGAYRYESHGKDLFEKVDGHSDSIQGVPSEQLMKFLTSKGFVN
jgi:septum formation protein